MHLTGERKKRKDIKEPLKCDYKTKNIQLLLQHRLNEHGTIIEREKEFKYYCKICDYGTISKDIYERHINTDKH